MSFRARLLLACLALALAPLVFFGLRARGEVAAQLGAQHAERVAALAEVIAEDLDRESAAVAARLDRVAEAMASDNRFRLALLDRTSASPAGADRAGAARAYLLDYASRAMPLAGLDLLRIQDEEGRVLSSGHFRHEYDAVDRSLPDALLGTGEAGVLAAFPTAVGPRLGLVRARTLQVGARTLTLVGGTTVDERFLDRLARGSGLEVELRLPGDGSEAAIATAAARDVAVRFAGVAGEAGIADGAGIGGDATARFVIRASADPLAALRREMDRWLLLSLGAAAALALVLAMAASSRLSRPLAALARKAERVDLNRLDVEFPTGRDDEVGTLSRVLDRMTRRLRASATRLREAERRAAVGELARQVNHDLRNGLVPIRNVVSHLAELARDRPDELPAVFVERQGTVDASLAYLDSLAASYARLSPKLVPRPCDLNAIARDVAGDAPGAVRATGAREAKGGGSARVITELDPALPAVLADPVALRRILENLIVNAVESLDGRSGRVVVWTRLAEAAGAASGEGDREPLPILFGVSDDGRGMTAEERARAFDHFYTTKPGGGGLGLSIVRRLVSDLGGRIEVESEPGAGARFTVELPGSSRGGAA